MIKLWVVTKGVNDYRQYGDYFIAAYSSKPTEACLRHTFPEMSQVDIDHILGGGGRRYPEGEWYTLLEVEPGQNTEEEDQL